MKHRLKLGVVPEKMAAAYASEGTIVLVGRFSKEGAFKEAVNDFLAAAEYLAGLGVDVRPALPSRDALIDQLRAATPVKSSGNDGRTFKNWFLRIDLRATHGIICLISCGTGRKLDESDVQPFVNRLAKEVRSSGAMAIVATRIDRLTRKAWSFGPVMLALDRVDGFLADARRGVTKVAGLESVMTFFSAQAAEDEADKMPAQLTRGMHTGTDAAMVSGRCQIAVGRAMPPGLFSYRSKVNGAMGPRIMTFDTPACIPDHRHVATGRPEVYDADGNQVDQVANVRWLFAALGKPGWTHTSLAQELMNRSFSTDYVRRRHGMSACYVADLDELPPKQYLNSILKHLDFYESGVLRINTGVEGLETITITNCVPPDGKPWATPEDFARIRTYEARVHPANPRGLAFAQVPATIDGELCLLMTRSFEPLDGSRRYTLGACLAAPYQESFKVLAPPTRVALPPTFLNEALAQALINAGDTAYAMFEASDVDTVDELVQREVRAAELRRDVLLRERDALRVQLSERTSDGQLVLSGTLLKELNDRFNELADHLIPQAELAVDQAGEALRAAVEEHRALRDGAAVEAVLGLVAALRDPHNLTYRELIRSSVRDLTITSQHRRAHHRSRQQLTVTFDFVIREGDNVLVIPVSALYVEKALASDWEAGERILKKLQSRPTTFDDVVPRNRRVAAHALAARLDMDGQHLMLPRIRDPRVAQLVALVLDDGDLEAVAEATGEPLTLIQRICEVHHTSQQATWNRGPGPRVYAIHEAADNTGVILRADGLPAPLTRWTDIRLVLNDYRERAEWSYDKPKWKWTLHPCPHCGGTRRRPASIPEPVGLVCLDCRRDAAGHVWDERYNVYLVPSHTAIAASTTKGLRRQRSASDEDRPSRRGAKGFVSQTRSDGQVGHSSI